MSTEETNAILDRSDRMTRMLRKTKNLIDEEAKALNLNAVEVMGVLEWLKLSAFKNATKHEDNVGS